MTELELGAHTWDQSELKVTGGVKGQALNNAE